MNFQENLPSGRQDTGEKAHCCSSQVAQWNKSSTILRARKFLHWNPRYSGQGKLLSCKSPLIIDQKQPTLHCL